MSDKMTPAHLRDLAGVCETPLPYAGSAEIMHRPHAGLAILLREEAARREAEATDEHGLTNADRERGAVSPAEMVAILREGPGSADAPKEYRLVRPQVVDGNMILGAPEKTWVWSDNAWHVGDKPAPAADDLLVKWLRRVSVSGADDAGNGIPAMVADRIDALKATVARLTEALRGAQQALGHANGFFPSNSATSQVISAAQSSVYAALAEAPDAG